MRDGTVMIQVNRNLITVYCRLVYNHFVYYRTGLFSFSLISSRCEPEIDNVLTRTYMSFLFFYTN